MTGQLEPINENYAIAKIAGIKLCESYNCQEAEMGRKAEHRFWELLKADKMVASYVDLYKELIGNE
jgi:hypothetical protein